MPTEGPKHITTNTYITLEKMAYVIINDNGKKTRELFDAKNITFRPPRILDHGGKIIGVSYKGQPLRIQTPEMVIPYGVSVFEDPNGTSKYSVDFSFRGMEDNEVLAQFHEQMREFEAALINAAIENSMSWFKKKMSPEVITEFFTPILKRSKNKETGEPDGKYPDTLKVKLDTKDGEFRCKAFAPDHSPIDEPLDSLLVKGTRAKTLILPSFLWFAGGKFGITIKAEQMRVKVVARNDKYGFVDDDTEDAEGEGEYSTTSGFVDDDADDKDETGGDASEEDEEVDVPEPTPTPKKPAAAAASRRRRKAD